VGNGGVGVGVFPFVTEESKRAAISMRIMFSCSNPLTQLNFIVTYLQLKS